MDAGRGFEDLGVFAAAVAASATIARLGARRRRKAVSVAAPFAEAPTSSQTANPTPSPAQRRSPRFSVIAPERLPTFSSVAGLDSVKAELRDTFGLVLSHAEEADAYRIMWNGLLLHGPPGVGKSFLIRALAGELNLNLVPVATADLVSSVVGAGPKLVQDAFAFAADHEPVVLFFDEFDAIAQRRRSDGTGTEVLLQLLQCLEATRANHRLLVAAATNDISGLDPAVIRPGRFDRSIRLDLPNTAARAAIFRVALTGRPVAKDVDTDELADRSRGHTPAALVSAVDAAALAAFRRSAGTGRIVRIAQADLVAALDHAGGQDRPMIEHWSWDRIVLVPNTLAELKELQAMLVDPERCRRFGVDPPTGLLLTGPPGTGKTTIAKVLAAEASCSFYPVTGADITSRWVGESEKLIARLFQRARDNAPSIIFIDEIDAITSARGELGAYDRQLDQLLQEIDGMSGQDRILVIGATNRPDRIDHALLRGGRLSRTIDIPLPDADARLAILELLTEPMPLRDIDLEDIALETEGFSGADLKALCQQAAVQAMIRGGSTTGTITREDITQALTVETAAVTGHSTAQDRNRRQRPLRAEDRPRTS